MRRQERSRSFQSRSSSLSPSQALKEVSDMVQKGYQMGAPDGCPPSIYNLMKNCWELEPGKRPSFKKLTEKLQKALTHTDSA